jgi:hypothetical protein
MREILTIWAVLIAVMLAYSPSSKAQETVSILWL